MRSLQESCETRGGAEPVGALTLVSSPERPLFLLSGSVEKVVSSTRQKRSHFWKQRHSY